MHAVVPCEGVELCTRDESFATLLPLARCDRVIVGDVRCWKGMYRVWIRMTRVVMVPKLRTRGDRGIHPFVDDQLATDTPHWCTIHHRIAANTAVVDEAVVDEWVGLCSGFQQRRSTHTCKYSLVIHITYHQR